MSDRTYAQLRILALPDDWTPADDTEARDLMADEGFETEADGYDLRALWTVDEMSVGSMEPIADALAALGITFEAWEDPKYEWLGAYYAHVPSLGMFAHDCDADGRPRFTAEEFSRILTLPEPDRLAALGQPWEAVIAPLRDAQVSR